MRPRGQSRSVQILTSQTTEFLINRTLFPAQTSPCAWCEPMSDPEITAFLSSNLRFSTSTQLSPAILFERASKKLPSRGLDSLKDIYP
ncbi:unnamed protein product [Sphagnum troendelagicum]|uniref:Uncharacterized protein n=1 Tax=Sphagnum troendelagicum TaxID=128251 RepID=A0ABP0UAM7_9BRYO